MNPGIDLRGASFYQEFNTIYVYNQALVFVGYFIYRERLTDTIILISEELFICLT